MGICKFKTSELKPLIEHAKAATEFDMGYENMTDEECAAAGLPPITNRTPRGPALLFVHDQGVYLMSNGEPRLLTEDGASNRVIYAEGCNPNIGEFDDWYSMSRELVGGDDFVEIIPIPDYWLTDCDAFEAFEINATGSSMSYGFVDPKLTTSPPAQEIDIHVHGYLRNEPEKVPVRYPPVNPMGTKQISHLIGHNPEK
jgi:hypothetical protein